MRWADCSVATLLAPQRPALQSTMRLRDAPKISQRGAGSAFHPPSKIGMARKIAHRRWIGMPNLRHTNDNTATMSGIGICRTA